MIPIVDLKAQYRSIKDEINEAVQGVLESGHFVLGPNVEALEKEVAEYCQCRYGVGVASGTDALRLSLHALGIGPGDEVLTTPFTFIATANTISHTGATPVFVDIDPRTYNVAPAKIEEAITERTKAILPVHLYGQPADMGPIMEIAKRYNLRVIEDCAQAIGAEYKGRRVGAFGDVGCLSFYPTKNLGAYGDGGMVVTNDPEIAERVDVLRRQGSRVKYHAELLGFNSRLDELQTAILRVKLKHLDEWTGARQERAHRYNELLSDSAITTPHEGGDVRHVYYLYTIRAPRRDELQDHLKRRGISSTAYYPLSLHRQKLYRNLGYGEVSLPQSERAEGEVLSLPMYPELTEEQQIAVAEDIRRFYE